MSSLHARSASSHELVASFSRAEKPSRHGVSRRSSDNSLFPQNSLDLYKEFLNAEKAEVVVLTFYKLRLSLGLGPVERGPVQGQYELLRDKILPLVRNDMGRETGGVG